MRSRGEATFAEQFLCWKLSLGIQNIKLLYQKKKKKKRCLKNYEKIAIEIKDNYNCLNAEKMRSAIYFSHHVIKIKGKFQRKPLALTEKIVDLLFSRFHGCGPFDKRFGVNVSNAFLNSTL